MFISLSLLYAVYSRQPTSVLAGGEHYLRLHPQGTHFLPSTHMLLLLGSHFWHLPLHLNNPFSHRIRLIYVPGPILDQPDKFWRHFRSGRTTFGRQNWSGRTDFSPGPNFVTGLLTMPPGSSRAGPTTAFGRVVGRQDYRFVQNSYVIYAVKSLYYNIHIYVVYHHRTKMAEAATSHTCRAISHQPLIG